MARATGGKHSQFCEIMKKEPILLIGAGGHCHSIIDLLEKQGAYHILGLVDVKEKIGTQVMGYPVLGCDSDLPELRKHCQNAVITVGQINDNRLRCELYNLAKKLNYVMPVIISPLAYVSPHANLQEGSVVLHHALVNANASIGVNCIINSKALIEHDAIIGNNCHISTACVVNGAARVDDNSFLGSGSVVIQGACISGFNKAGGLYK